MKQYTKNELKKVAQSALKSEYGFAPTLKEITLLEASEDATYILFYVNFPEYQYRLTSCHLYAEDGFDLGVWTGKGSIERI